MKMAIQPGTWVLKMGWKIEAETTQKHLHRLILVPMHPLRF